MNYALKRKLAIRNVYRDYILGPKTTLQYQLGHWVFNALLNRSLQGASTERHIETHLRQLAHRLG